MWPLDLPARDVLKLPGDGGISWAVFDPAWYRLQYPADTAGIGGENPFEVLQFYLDAGQAIGHSPNRMFDEQWHRAVYPGIARAVEAGHYASAFDAYCRRGSLDRSAHWLFDELAYRDRYRDLSDDVLAAAKVANGYDHYLRHGINEDRVGHVLFDSVTYLANFDAADIPSIRRDGVFQHFLNRIECAEPELRTSIYFDPIWYLDRYPQVAAGVAAGLWTCALHHYLCNDTPTAFDPLESFSEAHYLNRDPGLAEVIASRHFRNGYMHFLQFGARELRSPSPTIDLARYAAQASVRSDLEQGKAPTAFAHWLTLGRIAAAVPDLERISPAAARGLLDQQAIAMLPIAGRFGYRFESTGEPVVSVVITVRNGFASTMATIASLHADAATGLELIIVDRGSEDEVRSIGRYVPGAKLLAFDTDIGPARAMDAGRQLATGRFILFLDADARIVPGSIGRATERLRTEPNTGAVGGMVVRPDGVIGQAGGIIWNDGGTHDYQRGRSPLAPEANFVRTVDFCSAAFLLARADLLGRLDGFDYDCSDDYATIDLCLRIASAGFRVIYDPSVMVFHDDGAAMPVGADAWFLGAHATDLAKRYAPGGDVQVFARHAGPGSRRVLFIEDTVPLRHTGSGFVRSNDIVRVMADLGCAVTVFPMNASRHDRARVFGDMPDTAEVMHDQDFSALPAFLAGRAGYYDTIWVARTHNMDRVRSCLPADCPLIVLDTEAVTALREAEVARLLGKPFDMDGAMQALLRNADICHRVVAVTPAEAEVLQIFGRPDVSVIGHMIEPRPTVRPFGQRSGMLFVGAFHTMDCPNLDSLDWFVDAILPLIEADLGWETRLTIAGYQAPGIDLSRFANHPRITLRGPVADLDPLYNSSRVFIAPTRFAAGAPYKVFEAASRGVPVVATELLVRQLDWTPEQEILTADVDDAAAFAAAVVALYRDEAVWRTIREGALRRLRRENGRARFSDAVAGALSI